MYGLLRLEFFKEVNVSLTKNSQRKQVIGIILVVVFLLTIFVYGTRGCRPSRNGCNPCSKETTKAKSCQAENGSCPVETKSVQ
jgi:hypothetical protein